MSGYWGTYALLLSGAFVWWAYKKKEETSLKGLPTRDFTWDRF